jgi:hypothetical protein
MCAGQACKGALEGQALARTIDGWLATHAERVQAAQARWFGERSRSARSTT